MSQEHVAPGGASEGTRQARRALIEERVALLLTPAKVKPKKKRSKRRGR